MDPIRHEFIEQIRPYRDRPDIVKRIWWYEALPGAKWLGVQSAFSNPIYGDRRFKPHVGLNFGFEPTHRPLCRKHPGTRWVGSEDNWRNGVLTTDPPDLEPCPCASVPEDVQESASRTDCPCLDFPFCVHLAGFLVSNAFSTYQIGGTFSLGRISFQSLVCGAGYGQGVDPLAITLLVDRVGTFPNPNGPGWTLLVQWENASSGSGLGQALYWCDFSQFDCVRGGLFTLAFTDDNPPIQSVVAPSTVTVQGALDSSACPTVGFEYMDGVPMQFVNGADVDLIHP